MLFICFSQRPQLFESSLKHLRKLLEVERVENLLLLTNRTPAGDGGEGTAAPGENAHTAEER